jgi:signal transduction histidine kinase
VRLSRELHDTLLQGMVGVALQLEAVSDPSNGPPAVTAEWLRRMRRYLEEYIREARQSIGELRSAKLQSVDLASALRDNAVSSVSGTNIQVDFDTFGDHAQLRPPVEAAILRIGNEAISNAVRHSGSEVVRVQLAYSSLAFQLTVHDQGRGFEVPQVSQYAAHFGLLTMKERAAEIEADLRLDSRPGGGTTVTLTVPLA